MKETGLVIELKENKAVVEFERSPACTGCKACSASVSGTMRTEATNNLGAEVGDRVALNVRSKNMVAAYAIVFIIPLIFLLAGFYLGLYLSNYIKMEADTLGFIMALASLGLSYIVIRKLDRRASKIDSFRPEVVKVYKREGA
ncbi:MAG: SoxR reducing system RseC family protein [Actinomycetota bacterium]|nr:SoxR reducing system RseC family protein [Actinomycetota bacterium]